MRMNRVVDHSKFACVGIAGMRFETLAVLLRFIQELRLKQKCADRGRDCTLGR